MADISFHLVTAEPECAVIRNLFREYQDEIGVDLSFQDFSGELASLPGAYAMPNGRLYLACVDEHPAGCIALRPMSGDACEMKRLFVRSPYRHLGLGRMLSEHLIFEARSIGYKRMLLDTLPMMGNAQSLYRSIGFAEIKAYRFNPVPGAVYMERKLDDFAAPLPLKM